LGYDSLSFSYKFKKFVGRIKVNNIESALKRGSAELSVLYPINKTLSLYVLYFKGYGQSLIEYNHKTQSFGIGFSLRDWS